MENENKICLLNISDIKIVNPRIRGQIVHNEIVKNIRAVGLKRPVTVRKLERDPQGFLYALICGQGRIEALEKLGYKQVPAIIKNVDEKTGYVMSLVENIARRKPRATELLAYVKELKDTGMSNREVGKRIGYSSHWVNDVTFLLDRGEKKLLASFESGHIPLSIAIAIARSSHEQSQQLLQKAYEEKSLTVRQISKLRKILQDREKGNKGGNNIAFVHGKEKKKITLEELIEAYQKTTDDREELRRKSEYVSNALLLVKEMTSNLMKSKEFEMLLEKESLDQTPEIILKALGTRNRRSMP